MSKRVISVEAAFDEEAGVWFVKSSDLHGVNAEAPTLDTLVAKLPDVILDLLDDDGSEPEEDIALDIVAHLRRAMPVRRAA